MDLNPEGSEKIFGEIDKVRKRELIYIRYTIEERDSLKYSLLGSKENTIQNTARDIVNKDKLVEVFEQCRSEIEPDKASFMIYDFGYFGANGLFRNVLCAISYIPDHLSTKTKVIFSTSCLNLPRSMNIPLHIMFHTLDEFSYAEVLRICMAHKKN